MRTTTALERTRVLAELMHTRLKGGRAVQWS
jgi:hypothetical protein